jgi:hypothetical protein
MSLTVPDSPLFLPEIDLCEVEPVTNHYIASQWSVCEGSCGITCCGSASLGEVADPATGRVHIPIPEKVRNEPGIYSFTVAVMEPACRGKDVPLVLSRGLCMIEPSGFGNRQGNCSLPSLSDVRWELDDYASKNDLWNSQEYSDFDIVHALAKVVHTWNETKPLAGWMVYDCRNFPMRELWIKGAVCKLVSAKIWHFLRNKQLVQATGLSIDTKNRDNEYKARLEELEQRFITWLVDTKVGMNFNAALGVVSTDLQWNTPLPY